VKTTLLIQAASTLNCLPQAQTTRFVAKHCPTAMEMAGGMRLSKWCETVGICRTTAWRLRKTGQLKVVTRYGQHFVTAEGMREFFKSDGSKPHMLAKRRESPVRDTVCLTPTLS